MAISAISASNAALSFQAEQNAKAVRTARDEQSKVGKGYTGRSKAEEEKALVAASQAAGVGSSSLSQTLVESQKKVEKSSQIGNNVNAGQRQNSANAQENVGGSPRPSAAKTTDQVIKAIAARGGDETSTKVQQQRADRLASEVQKSKADASQRVEDQRITNIQTKILQAAAYQRSDAANLQVTRAKLADQAEASKAQNVEVKAVEKADPRLAAAKVLNEQVQRNQEVAQVSRDKQASSAQLKILITSNADKLKQSLQESSELAKDTSRKPVPPSPVGQRIDIKA